jgi:hypothetical protein
MIAGIPPLPILAAMSTRRPGRVRCGFVSNVALVVSSMIVASFAACNRDDVAGGPGASGAGGTGGGPGGSTLACNPTGVGCLCLIDDAQLGQLTACSPSSVAQNEMERGTCCVAQALCSCIRYSCRSDPASAYCQCGTVATLAGMTLGSPVAECPAPVTGQKCCFSQDNATCICSRLACPEEETEVANCSAAAAGACASGEAIEKCR